MSDREIGFEEDADGNRGAVLTEGFDMASVERALGEPVMDEEDVEREAVRRAIQAVLDILIPPKVKGSALARSAGRNAILLAHALGHSSCGHKSMSAIAKAIGLQPGAARKQLHRVIKRARIL